MSLIKFASFESAKVLDVKGSPKRRTASLDKVSDFDDYRTDDNYLYVRIRAISSRVNKNHDGWPSIELAGGQEKWDELTSKHKSSSGFKVQADTNDEYGFSTFVGKPVFVDHHNSDPKRARGVIVDAALNVLDHKTAAEGDSYWGSSTVDPEHLPPTEVELLLEIDAENFPKLAKAIIDGDIDGFSMGADVEYSKCSHCSHIASSPSEFCKHIKTKGAEYDYVTADGTRTSRKTYENCFLPRFFELSAVFDPADETALTKEIKTAVYKEADGVFHQPQIEEILQLAKKVKSDNPGMTVEEAMPMAEQELNRKQGSFLGAKIAEAPEPRSMHVKAPQEVDTLREEQICPLCGSDITGPKCDVCNFEPPPKGLDNPDLTKGEDEELDQEMEQQEAFVDPAQPDPAQPDPAALAEGQEENQGKSYLNTKKTQATSKVINSMRWTPKIYKRGTAPKPQGDEPEETTISDQSTPVTSSLKTAQDMVEAAKHNQKGNKMSNGNWVVAAEPADSDGKAKKRVNVDGVGGVDQSTNEQASKAKKQVDPKGKGGVDDASNQNASKPDKKENITDTADDNAGFDDSKTTDDSGPTKTWDNSNEPNSAVTDKAMTAANKGTQPIDPSGKADDRIDVETPPHDRVGPGTDQWTGTNGNGVTKQLDPVTNKTPWFSSHIVAALKQADAEVGLGILSKDEKYNRLSELADLSPEELAAEARVTARVKTAGLQSTPQQTRRLPSFKRVAGAESPKSQSINDALLDNALFG
jgi:hypothetical protein